MKGNAQTGGKYFQYVYLTKDESRICKECLQFNKSVEFLKNGLNIGTSEKKT